jgi:A/G-specific adenine glycosylase
VKDFSKKLLHWSAKFGRSGLPWQNQKDPYRVWVSEIMLQQTQVVTVIDRYIKFLEEFPTVNDLASASSDNVMAQWAGLGYYTRARNLHACANKIVTEYGGQFPKDALTLSTLPGIGKSTAAAIASFCFDQKISILDANVKRVLARVFAIEDDLKKSKISQELWNLAQTLVPTEPQKMPAYTQALMDFGATVCTPKNPKCSLCVMNIDCQADIQKKVDQIPLVIKKKKSVEVQSEMLLIQAKDQVLLMKRPLTGIWGGLWSLPETPWQEYDPSGKTGYQLANYENIPSTLLQQNYLDAKVFAPRKHVFSHRILYFQVRRIQLSKVFDLDHQNMQWVLLEDIKSLGLPTPIRQLMEDALGITF